MATRPAKTYVDTAVSGLVIQVEHNLGGTPDLQLTENDSGNEIYVSLYDPRIAEIKTLDENTIQLTFASSFAGWVYAMVHEADVPTLGEKVLDLQKRQVELLALLESKASIDMTNQLNTLTQSQIKSLQSQIDSLSAELALLKEDVAAL